MKKNLMVQLSMKKNLMVHVIKDKAIILITACMNEYQVASYCDSGMDRQVSDIILKLNKFMKLKN